MTRTQERRREDRQELTAVPTAYLTMLRVVLIGMILGLSLLMAFAYYAVEQGQAARTVQLEQQVRVLETLEELAKDARDGVEQHRESALKQHCAQALLETDDAQPTRMERKLIEKACTH